jgi:hypothetical protein
VNFDGVADIEAGNGLAEVLLLDLQDHRMHGV